MAPNNTYSWCSCLALSPPTQYQGGSMWPTEYGASKCVSLLRWGGKKTVIPELAFSLLAHAVYWKRAAVAENTQAACGEVREARGQGPAGSRALPTTTRANLFICLNFLFYIGGQLINNACNSFRRTAKGLNHACTRIHSPPNPAPIQAAT